MEQGTAKWMVRVMSMWISRLCWAGAAAFMVGREFAVKRQAEDIPRPADSCLARLFGIHE